MIVQSLASASVKWFQSDSVSQQRMPCEAYLRLLDLGEPQTSHTSQALPRRYWPLASVSQLRTTGQLTENANRRCAPHLASCFYQLCLYSAKVRLSSHHLALLEHVIMLRAAPGVWEALCRLHVWCPLHLTEHHLASS